MLLYYYVYIIFSSLELFWNPFGMVNLLQRIVCNKKKSLKHLKYTNICFHFSIHDSLHMDVSYGLLETWDINQTQNIKAENKDSVFSLKRSQVDTSAMPVTLLWALSFIYFRKIGTFRHLSCMNRKHQCCLPRILRKILLCEYRVLTSTSTKCHGE